MTVEKLTDVDAIMARLSRTTIWTPAHQENTRQELTQLTEALAAAEKRALVHSNSKLDEQKARDVAETRVRELEAELRDHKLMSKGVIEGLIGECRRDVVDCDGARDSNEHLTQQLAAANALLARVQRWRPPADQDPSTYDRGQRETLRLTLDIEAHERTHLSAQPAAPEIQPGQFDAEDWMQMVEPTDNDRAVLEATDGIPEYTISFWARCGSDVWMPFGKAVLARREAKR